MTLDDQDLSRICVHALTKELVNLLGKLLLGIDLLERDYLNVTQASSNSFANLLFSTVSQESGERCDLNETVLVRVELDDLGKTLFVKPEIDL